jgi:hypothetical protein
MKGSDARLQRRLVDLLEELAPARVVEAHPPVVQVLEQLGDRLVQLGQREEGLVAQARQAPAIRATL